MIPRAPLSRNRVFAATSMLASWLLMLSLNTQAPGQGVDQITVNAGLDQTITLPHNTATLNGSARGGVGLPFTSTWSEVNGPAGATVSFADPSNPQTTATFSTGGVYTLQLTASDGIGSGQSTVNITVNQAPVVNAGPNQTINFPNSATLSASASDDGLPNPPGALTYSWSMVTGPGTVSFANASATNTTASFSVSGIYTLSFTSNDGAASSSGNVVITVNQPPVVNAGSAQTIELPSSANLSGSASDDGLPNPPGALTYSWTMVSGPGTVTFSNSTALSTTASFSTSGSYTLQLAAFDGSATSARTVVITVYPFTQPPVVNAGPAQTITLPAAATLNGSATDDGFPNPPGALTYNWAMVTGPGVVTFANANAASTTATFSIAGSYTLRLTASDSALSGSADVVVTVGGPLPSPWVDQDVGAVGVSGSASYVPGSPSTFIESGSGADIFGTADAFHYAYQPLNGDGGIIARIATQQNTDSWAKAGVMIRETLASGATNAAVVVTPANGVAFDLRVSTNGTSTNTRATGIVAPYWVKLVRKGNVFTGYDSADGNTWKQ